MVLIEDKNIAFAMLNDLKYTCECLNQKVLETSNMQLRQNYINILNETFNEHKQLFDIMSKQGWHQPMIAEQQEISRVVNKISTMHNQVIQTMNLAKQQQQYIQSVIYERNNQGHQLY